MSSTTSNVKHHASRAAESKPLEYLARGGFIGYGIIHLLFAWIALQVAFGSSGQESDQSGALQELARHSYGKTLLVVIAVGLVAMAIWQAFEAAIGESGERNRTAMAERVLSGVRAVLYAYLAWMAVKVIQGANASMGDNYESKTSGLMSSSGGRWLVGLIGLVVLGIGVGMAYYGLKRKFVKHLNTGQMPANSRESIIKLGVAGYTAKGVAYGIAGLLVVLAAVNYDPEKARGLDAALKTLASYSWGVWVLAVIAAGIAAFGVYCIAQAKYRKI
ncbi:putative integral membrane protein [Actinoplanes missouriensis 431]|uniref:Putative integral membrane protein n=1 Tax=Actinoplanes missouriensis (strain ATCC 14538 / DSM 43046 / CBS 188.64 / JCM 3121 / NBRC 102363 / NCIMB 12654 / NRRL B-3342 / UNCC 431) TaxID=512565 RepID=I0HEU4_ACTM4|nr:DUF1206 domain-containing protein [Actinoplanes missouriensis]BAL91531.1 putative integral membrane protein [Actinoplanes missouriensis 431]